MKIIFLSVFLSLFIYAQNINTQIHALKHATPKERVALMNSIKQKLVMMNEDERVQTLSVLKARIHRERGEEHNDNQHNENISSHPQHNNHEMMHQSTEGAHMLHHNNNTDKVGHDHGRDKAGHSNNGGDKAGHGNSGHQSGHKNGRDKVAGHNGKGNNVGHDKKHSMIHAKVYDNNSRGR